MTSKFECKDCKKNNFDLYFAIFGNFCVPRSSQDFSVIPIHNFFSFQKQICYLRCFLFLYPCMLGRLVRENLKLKLRYY